MEQQSEKDHLVSQLTTLTQNYVENIKNITNKVEEKIIKLDEKVKQSKEMEDVVKKNIDAVKSKIKLDVGGKYFHTSKTTMLSQEGTYFYAMLSSGNWKPDEDGYYFIDRNPKYFGLILDYLRTGKLEKSNLNSNEITKLNDELDYYQIIIPRPILEINSKILDDDMIGELSHMLSEEKAFKAKCIHNSTNGTGCSQFDSAVKNLSPTLIVIKATSKYVFGAYVEDVWLNGSGWIKGSENNFLFTFGNISKGKIQPIKLLPNGNGEGIHISGCGLHMSNDLVAFCSHSCTPSVYKNIAPGYPNVVVDNKLLAGSQNWSPEYMEVFHLSVLK